MPIAPLDDRATVEVGAGTSPSWLGTSLERLPVIMAMLVFPSQVREEILEQHGEIRTLLRGAIDGPEVARSGATTTDAGPVRAIGLELCDRLQKHLVFEADALRPVFAALDYWGPERIRELDIEHARQREELDALRSKLESEEDLQELSADLSKLAGELLKDMDAEEDGCLRASLLCDVSLTVERR